MIAVGDGIAQWVCAGLNMPWTPGMPAIGWISGEGVPAAAVVYTDFNGEGSSISIHSRAVDRKRIGLEFYLAIFDYPFNQLGVRRVTGLVSTANLAAQRVNEKLGFTEEIRLPFIFQDGDGIVYRMLKEECRWLALTPRFRKEK